MVVVAVCRCPVTLHGHIKAVERGGKGLVADDDRGDLRVENVVHVEMFLRVGVRRHTKAPPQGDAQRRADPEGSAHEGAEEGAALAGYGKGLAPALGRVGLGLNEVVARLPTAVVFA